MNCKLKQMTLISNPHLNLKTPSSSSVCMIKGCLNYYHYVCDGTDDRGWGCGYRTLQSILSWIKNQQEAHEVPEVPSILDIQKALVEMHDKKETFIGSREWIGSVEVAYCIEFFYEVQCRIIHSRDVNDLKEHARDIANHFTEFGSPVMMGGDKDCSSKCILGISLNEDDVRLLILDPHCSDKLTSTEEVQSLGWVKWQPIESLDHSSFYNICCPLLKGKG